MTLASGHKWEVFSPELQERYNKDFTGEWNDVVRLQPGGWILTKRYLQLQDKIYNFKFRPDDVIVMTYPKCGTTWGQEIVWTMRKNPNLDNPDMKDALFVRSPYIEMDLLFDPAESAGNEQAQAGIATFLTGADKYCSQFDIESGIAFQIAEGHKGGRTLKTHLPFSMFPKSLIDTCKVVYVARNVKDNLLSSLNHHKSVSQHSYVGDLDNFISWYTQGFLLYGNYSTHLKEAMAFKNHPNLHITFYEDLKADFIGEVKRLDAFIGTGLSEQQMLNVQKHTTFDNMKANNTHPVTGEGNFFFQGQAGGWKGKYTPEQEAAIDAYVEENIAPLGLLFKSQ